MNENEKGKILILELNNRLFSILIRGNRILLIQSWALTKQIQSLPKQSPPLSKQLAANSYSQDKLPTDNNLTVGSIHVGMVQNVAVNIGAAFVELQNSEMTFFPLAELKDAIITNRQSDGRLKSGDELLVQIVKEPVKTKLASVSSKLSLTGSYVIVEYRKNADKQIRISSKLGAKYNHLYKNLEPLKEITEKFNIIIRTNAENAEDTSDVIDEARTLSDKLSHILEIADKRTCFSCLYKCEAEYITFIKNCYRYEYDEIITDEREIYDSLLEDSMLKTSNIRFYEDKMLPLYKLYSIETRIRELTEKKVWLKSGAYIIIEQTEALIAIDVNTGKYESRKDKEETYFKINLEAAEEIAFQLRARNLAGMILVDFINMSDEEHVKQLTQRMKELLKNDAIPANVVDITGLGLMEITRKKKGKPFAEQGV